MDTDTPKPAATTTTTTTTTTLPVSPALTITPASTLNLPALYLRIAEAIRALRLRHGEKPFMIVIKFGGGSAPPQIFDTGQPYATLRDE